MTGATTIDEPIAGGTDPDADDLSPDWTLGGDCSDPFAIDLVEDPPDALEDESDVPSPDFFATTPPAQRFAVGLVQQAQDRPVGPAILAVLISLVVHAGIALAVLWVTYRHHVFVAAHPRQVQGDGAVVSGAIDHDGNDSVAGAAGLGSLLSGWCPPVSGGATPTVLDPPAQDASDPAPAPAPPPDAIDPSPAAAPVAMDVTVSPMQPELLPVFAHRPATRPIAVASTQPAGGAKAPMSPRVAAEAARSRSSADQAVAAGFSSRGSTDPGGPLRRSGAGGSNGRGGAVTGNSGTAVTGRPGVPAGVKGMPLEAEYPDYCREQGEAGRVVIEADILADGTVASLKVLSDAGHHRLAQAALDAFQGRQFHPALLDGRPVRSTRKFPFAFELR